MNQSKIRDENFFLISGWMLNRLNLKGILLEVFAIIYGFSQDGESEFTGSIQYLCDFTGVSRPTITKALKELVERDYLIKNEQIVNGVKFNRYKANLQVVKKLYRGSKETLQGGSKETLHNNIDIDNIVDNNRKKERKKKETSYDEILSVIEDSELKELYCEYIKMRKFIKAPMTDRALKMLINRVNVLEPTDINRQKRTLETAIINTWKNVYKLKDDNNKAINHSPNNKKDEWEGYCKPLDDDPLPF